MTTLLRNATRIEARAQAVGALTAAPARALGLGSQLGLLEAGYAADVVVLDDDLHVIDVWAAGARL